MYKFILESFEARSSFVDFVSEKLGPNAICLSVFLFLLNFNYFCLTEHFLLANDALTMQNKI